MPKKRYNAEEIIPKLRAADVLPSAGVSSRVNFGSSIEWQAPFSRTPPSSIGFRPRL